MTTSDEKPLRWEFSDHICRICFSRVLTRTTFDKRKIYICSNCETEMEGDGPQALCCCGIKLRTNKDAGIRCGKNPRRTPENPSRVIAEQVDIQISTRK